MQTVADPVPGVGSDADPHAYLTRLNPEQRAAVEHGVGVGAGAVPGPLLVIAGAGSGKTNVLAHRVAHLVARGADPGHILLLTFSRRAADEMARRVERIVRQVAAGRPQLAGAELAWAGTFHSIGARLLREYAPRIGLDPAFTIHDREDSADLMNLVRHELGLADTGKRFPRKQTCLAIYSAAVNTLAPLADVLAQRYPWCADFEDELKRLFRAYVEAKQAQHVLDYDDLLLYWSHMVEAPALAAEIGARFRHVLVDEYQDTNALQASIVRALKPDGAGVTVVGDDAQSIYAFRGATVRNILDFPGQFAPPARIVTLERNYRSTQPILAAANGVIARATEGYVKALWSERESAERPQLVSVRDEADQAAFVVEQVLARRETGIALKQQAVLFRAAHHSAAMEIELVRRNIPFVKFGGLKFLEAAHVKDVLAVLRWIENPRDRVAGFRMLQLMSGVGPKTAAQVLDQVASVQDVAMALREARVPAAAAPAWQDFLALVEALHGREVPWPAEFETIAGWYGAHLERLYEDAAVREGDLAQLAQIARTYPSRQRFLTELTLDPPDATSDEAGVPLRDEDYLILSTIHSAKGQEWKAVTLLNAVDGCIPSDLATGTPQEIEEERRLLYVAMTRAKDHLQIVVPQRFYVTQQTGYGDRHVYAGRTRFIPPGMAALFDSRAWPEAPAAPAASPPPPEVVEVLSKMKAMWN
ncbi:ATP-dependent helicase [Thiobacillus sedimenti]|uniref:DNA 3'-5' helicase n=1 Tax=Thiobacillus sedimenti TaxID=3110231 RepID=A0ABZ1CMN6_9PROT|nr:ATP-dependent helicase [Thiobacillus sp. SCUT-2]WRS40664.1 ATP-dependent helicase [Thiobacillus sp. SCUT-2]